MAALMQQLQAWVSASGILADKMAVIMIIALFGLTLIASLAGKSVIKGLIAGSLGMVGLPD